MLLVCGVLASREVVDKKGHRLVVLSHLAPDSSFQPKTIKILHFKYQITTIIFEIIPRASKNLKTYRKKNKKKEKIEFFLCSLFSILMTDGIEWMIMASYGNVMLMYECCQSINVCNKKHRCFDNKWNVSINFNGLLPQHKL